MKTSHFLFSLTMTMSNIQTSFVRVVHPKMNTGKEPFKCGVIPQFDFRHRQASCAAPRNPSVFGVAAFGRKPPLYSVPVCTPCRVAATSARSWTAVASAARHRFRTRGSLSHPFISRPPKAPSPLRSAGALQNRPSQNENRKRSPDNFELRIANCGERDQSVSA